MKRREVIKRTVLASGAALSAPLYSSLLSGCSPSGPPETTYSPSAFSPEQYTLLEKVANTLLPATDTPSASQAGVPPVVDRIVAEVYSPEQQEAYFRQFALLEVALQDASETDEAGRKALLQRLEASDGELKGAWAHLKQQLIAMYLSSEVVAENHLNYLPVPGTYESCIQLSDTNGKAWAI